MKRVRLPDVPKLDEEDQRETDPAIPDRPPAPAPPRLPHWVGGLRLLVVAMVLASCWWGGWLAKDCLKPRPSYPPPGSLK